MMILLRAERKSRSLYEDEDCNACDDEESDDDDDETRLRAKVLDDDANNLEAYVEFRDRGDKRFIKCEIENLPAGETFQCAVEVGGELMVFAEISIPDGEIEAQVKLQDADYPAGFPETFTVDDLGVLLDADGGRLFEANFQNK